MLQTPVIIFKLAGKPIITSLYIDNLYYSLLEQMSHTLNLVKLAHRRLRPICCYLYIYEMLTRTNELVRLINARE
jgi:hypothetical protein